jgi:hypothetical protein
MHSYWNGSRGFHREMHETENGERIMDMLRSTKANDRGSSPPHREVRIGVCRTTQPCLNDLPWQVKVLGPEMFNANASGEVDF